MAKLKTLTGSQGKPLQDMTPRAAFALVFGFGAGAVLDALGVDTLAIGGLAPASAVLVLAGFDYFVKPRL
jgi:hypothetical protein